MPGIRICASLKDGSSVLKKFYKRLHLSIEVSFNYKGGRWQIFKEPHVSNYICSLE